MDADQQKKKAKQSDRRIESTVVSLLQPVVGRKKNQSVGPNGKREGQDRDEEEVEIVAGSS